jgi:hypothetical protein
MESLFNTLVYSPTIRDCRRVAFAYFTLRSLEMSSEQQSGGDCVAAFLCLTPHIVGGVLAKLHRQYEPAYSSNSQLLDRSL